MIAPQPSCSIAIAVAAVCLAGMATERGDGRLATMSRGIGIRRSGIRFAWFDHDGLRAHPVLTVALFVIGGGATARAGALASLVDDVDGNGTQDSVELTADGVVHIGDATHAEIKVATAVGKARILVSRAPAGTQLVVDVTSGATHEAIVLGRTPAKGWGVITRFALGGVGLDREYAIEVDATVSGVYRFQSRSDVRRCDDQPAYLFGERLEAGGFRRLDRLPSNIPSSAAVLPVTLDGSPATAPLIYQARAASYQPGVSDAGGLGIPRELDDGRLDTGWHEDLAGHGEGQFFTFKPRVDIARAGQLRIVPGNPTSPARMKASSRPRGIAIVTKQGAWRLELPDAANAALGAAYVVDLPPGAFECVTVVLESAYGQGPTSIAELGIYADGERTGGGERLLAKVVADGTSGATSAAAALARRGAAGVAAIDHELANTADPGVRRRLIGALAKISDPSASASLVRAATDGWVRDKDLIDVIAALAANGEFTALRDLAAKPALPLELRLEAVRHVQPSDAGLVELAGKGPRALRHAVIEQLAGAPVDTLVRSAQTRSEPTSAGDLWRAATRSARANPADRPAAAAAMTAALANATDYELRYRLIDGIASYGDDATLAELERVLGRLPTGAHTAALRQVAIRGIASSPRERAMAIDPTGLRPAPPGKPSGSPPRRFALLIVVAYARDPDPGVRLAALSAIANAETDSAGAWHDTDGPAAIDRVLIGAMTDAWPEVRRRAASGLGTRCGRLAPARALFEAVGTDRDLDVRNDSLTALVQCRAAGIRELLAQTWDSAKQPIQLRQHAIDLVVSLEDHQLAEALVRKFTRWRGQAIESAEAMLLAQSAAAAIGRLAPAGAAQALTAALDDSAFPEIVSAAALALGALGPACPAVAKAKLTALARADDQSSIVAKRAAAQCGR